MTRIIGLVAFSVVWFSATLLGALLQLIVYPGGVEDILITQFRRFHQVVWGVWALGVAYFLVPGLEAGMAPILAQHVQGVRYFFSRSFSSPVMALSLSVGCPCFSFCFLVILGNSPIVGGLTFSIACRHLGALPPARGHQPRQFHAVLDQVLGVIAIWHRVCTSYRLREVAPAVQQTLDVIIERFLLLHRVVEHLAKAGEGAKVRVFKNARFLNTSSRRTLARAGGLIPMTLLPVTYGYARVSKSDDEARNLETQLRLLADHGIRQDLIFSDVATGRTLRRTGWQERDPSGLS